MLEFELIYFQDDQKSNYIRYSLCLKIDFSELNKGELLFIGIKDS